VKRRIDAELLVIRLELIAPAGLARVVWHWRSMAEKIDVDGSIGTDADLRELVAQRIRPSALRREANPARPPRSQQPRARSPSRPPSEPARSDVRCRKAWSIGHWATSASPLNTVQLRRGWRGELSQPAVNRARIDEQTLLGTALSRASEKCVRLR
jgi:hypothetical protein